MLALLTQEAQRAVGEGFPVASLPTSSMWQERGHVTISNVAEIVTMVHYTLHLCLVDIVFTVNCLIRSPFPSGVCQGGVGYWHCRDTMTKAKEI